MAIWCMAHPWMTFFISIFAIACIDNCVVAIANAIINHNPQDGGNETEEGNENEDVNL